MPPTVSSGPTLATKGRAATIGHEEAAAAAPNRQKLGRNAAILRGSAGEK